MIGASTVETLVGVKNAIDRAPVYVHMDVDVLDSDGGLSPEKLYDLLEAVAEDSPPVGLEVTGADEGAAETVLQVLEPLLDAIPEGAAHVDG